MHGGISAGDPGRRIIVMTHPGHGDAVPSISDKPTVPAFIGCAGFTGDGRRAAKQAGKVTGGAHFDDLRQRIIKHRHRAAIGLWNQPEWISIQCPAIRPHHRRDRTERNGKPTGRDGLVDLGDLHGRQLDCADQR